MNRVLAFMWLVMMGTNAAQYYSQTEAVQAAVILLGAVYFLFAFRSQFLRLALFPDYLLLLGIFVVPVVLMWTSDRTFARGEYTSEAAFALVFVVSSVLASRVQLARTVAIAGYAIVVAATILNLYELFIQNNVWSLAPGRSAGFYLNPNISGEALLGYGLVYLVSRVDERIRAADVVLICLVVVGVFVTFSRASILAGPVLLTLAIALRASRKQLLRVVLGAVAISLMLATFGFFVLHNFELSKDAEVRVLSLVEEGGVGDYREDRGMAAAESFDLAMESPLTGVGVRTIYDMAGDGPHNMFIAMMVEYGILGLIAYVIVIARLIAIARRAPRKQSALVLVIVAWLIIFSFASHDLLSTAATIPLLGFAIARARQIRDRRFSAARTIASSRVSCEY